MKPALGLSVSAVAAFVSGARATNTWLVDITYSNPMGAIIDQGDTATVTLWAQFDDNMYAFAAAALNVHTGDDTGSWSDFDCDLKAGGTFEGIANGGDVTGIITGQLYDPIGNIFPDTSNPIQVWHGTFTVSDFTTRIDMLATETSKYYAMNDSGFSYDLTDSLLEGSVDIGIGIPTQGTASALVLGALFPPRRRR